MSRKICFDFFLMFALVSFSGQVSTFVDGLVISRSLGPDEIAVHGLIKPYFTILSMCAGMVGLGMQLQCSHAMATGDRQRVVDTFSRSCIFVFALSVTMMLLGYLFSEPLSVALGANGDSADLLPLFLDYNKGFFCGVPPLMMGMLLSVAVNVDGKKRVTLIAAIAKSVINIIGDVLAVRVFRAGLFGVELATSVCEVFADVILILSFRRKSVFRFRLVRMSARELFSILSDGSTRLTLQGAFLLSNLMMNYTVLHFGGKLGASAMSMRLSVYSATAFFGIGITSTVTLIAKIFYSEQDKTAVRRLHWQTVLYCFGIYGIIGAGLFFGAPLVIRLFFPEATKELSDIALVMMRWYAASMPFNALARALSGFMVGAGKKIISNVFTITSNLSVSVFALLFAVKFGLDGIWAALLIGELFSLLIYGALTLAVNRRKKLSDSLMLIPETFDRVQENSMEMAVSDEAAVCRVSDEVKQFCLSRGIDASRAYAAALCLEEIADNVVTHGFRSGQKNRCVIRVLWSQETDEVTLRVRDDCAQFDFVKFCEQNEYSPESFSNIGVHLVSKKAKDLIYVSTLNTNTLIVKI